MKTVLVVNGPNMNTLGWRETGVYGAMTLEQIERNVIAAGEALGLSVRCFQSNHEGAIIDEIHRARGTADGIVMNPGAFTHYSYAIRDAIAAVALPAIEVHLSNVYKREPFRHVSVTAPVMLGVVAGLGPIGYELALQALAAHLANEG
ncbi:type II 3-dehydroquinate dehydratase [Paenibacillus sp.]|uniref:type II 3-dehydroquinate dehydratase n=1 Tax=Paenibacillus sp. TaxID=58172 RepID=UPI002D6B62F8|nr:type II 3-dehydroquinate dehydratase [Paenibacillus sp.]HZG58073.1 type II 3-dehydroquinate dehydratase [Paenibacillus sp.]